MFDIIVAIDVNKGIGFNSNGNFCLPWKNTTDMTFFKNKTTDCTPGKLNAVIMGKNTYMSLPIRKDNKRYLQNRFNIVISKTLKEEEGILVYPDLSQALSYIKTCEYIENTFVIGGSQLYETALESDQLRFVYVNTIFGKYESNIHFPEIDSSKFQEDSSYEYHNLDTGGVRFSRYCRVERDNQDEENYLNLLRDIMTNGDVRQTRNSVTKSLFGKQLSFDLKNKFPLLTTKKMFLRGIFEELMWFLRGQTNSKILEEKKVNIWKGNTTEEFIKSMNLDYAEGDVGNMYGFQWKHFGTDYHGCDKDYTNKGYDQIEYVLNLLRNDKYSRRILMTTYAPDKAYQGVLYPCHGIVVQFYVREDEGINYLSCHMYQRSADMFLGVPFNISSYALLVYILCEVLNNGEDHTMKFKPDKLTMSFGDVHIYSEHFSQVETQISREPKDFPRLEISSKSKLEDFEWEDVKVQNYVSHERIVASMVA
jgi:dihydrofolate reductase/thymidylate synthase